MSALAILICLVGSMSISAQTTKSNKEEFFTVRGTVFNSVTHAPVGHALVYSPDNRFAKLTDDHGHFEFKVPRPPDDQRPTSEISFYSASGHQTRIITSGILFMARKQGYVDSDFAQSSLDADSFASSELKISLVPEALVIGRVNLPSNDGTDQIQVEIYRREVQEGRARWVTAGVVSSRANGDFRFASLREGEYKLFTHELLDRDPLTFDPRGQLFGYPPVYYPAAEDFESAAVIRLKAGEIFSGTLTPERREYFPVKLGMLNAALKGGHRITVDREGHRGPGYSLGFNRNENTIEGMLPNGNYTVEVTQHGENASAGILNFSVNGAPTNGPSLMLVPNSFIEVRVIDERANPQNAAGSDFRNDLNMFNLMLVPRDEFRLENWVQLQPPKNQEDTSLAFRYVQPGSYSVHAGCNPSAYVAAVTGGGKDLLRQPLEVAYGAAIPPIEITIRDDGAQLAGTIENWPWPESEVHVRSVSPSLPGNGSVQVVLLPLAESSGQSRQVCQTWVSPAGEYTFPLVPPGEYRVIALEHFPADLEYENADSLRKFEPRGQVVRLVAGQHEHLQLTLNTGVQ